MQNLGSDVFLDSIPASQSHQGKKLGGVVYHTIRERLRPGDSEDVAEIFDEREPAVTEYLHLLITRARELGLATSICGQAPSVHPEYADLLVRAGIDAISVNIDAVDRARRLVAAAEQRVLLDTARDPVKDASV